MVNTATETPKIVIEFPSTIILASVCTYSGVSGQLSSSLTCTAANSGADGRYELTNPFGGSDYATTGTNLEIQVGTVTNPDVSGSPGTFTVSTYLIENSIDYLVDTGTYSSVSITTGTLTSPSVTSTSTLAYDTGVNYTFTFTTQHTVVTNGVIDIVFPSSIIINDSSAASSDCQAALNGAALSSATCVVVSTGELKVTSLFTTAATGTVTVVIPGIRNPRSLGTSESFTVTTTDSSGTAIDSLSTGFTVTMLSVSELQAVSIENTETDEINGEYDPYQVIVTAQTPTANGDKVILKFPTSMSFPASSSNLS